MRKIFWIIALLASLPLYSQWLPNGNNMKLDTKGDKVNDFVISEDSKFIYTLGDSGVIAKYDAGTGERVWRKEIEPEQNITLNFDYIFMSSDARTCCVGYNWFTQNSDKAGIKTIFFIYDLNNLNLLDSIKIVDNYTSSGNITDFHFAKINYFSQEKMFLFSYFVNVRGYGQNGWYYGYTGGNLKLIRKKQNGEDTLYSVNGNPFFILYNQKPNYLMNNGEYSEFADSYPNYNNVFFYQGKSSEFFNIDSNKNINFGTLINKYYQQNNADTLIDAYLNFSSGYFLSDNKKLILSCLNKVYQINLDTLSLDHIDTLKFYPNDKNVRIEQSVINQFYFVVKADTLHIHKIQNGDFCKSFTIDSFGLINKMDQPKDSINLFLSDNFGKIIKISNDSIFKLHANFATDDTIYTVIDTVHFTDCSLGNPDSFYWDFGDGYTSKLQNPSHIYSNTGFYRIKLIVNKGKLSDTVYKQKYIEILPELRAGFEYSITGTFPIKARFFTATKGNIDSLKWDFGNTTFSNFSSSVVNYYYSGNYNVSLTVYSKTKISKETKNVKINVIVSTLNPDIFKYEKSISYMPGYYSIKGYESDFEKIMYQVSNDAFRFIGAMQNMDTLWNLKIYGASYFVRKNNGDNVYFHNDTISHFNDFGEINKQTLGIVNNFYRFNDFVISNNNLSIAFETTQHIVGLVDNLDTMRSTALCDYVFHIPNSNYKATYVHFNFKAFIDSIKYDWCKSQYIIARSDIDNITENLYYYRINNKDYPYQENYDFIRINDSLLVAGGKNYINIITSYGLPVDSSKTKLPTTNYLHDSVRIDSCIFRSLLKLNDTAFAVAGSYRGSPNVMIFNDKGAILDSVTLSDRFGEFEFVSLTPDNKLLLSGYRYMTYQVKSPYFVKFGDDILTNLLPISGVTPEKPLNKEFKAVCYPNPTNGFTTIKFNLPASSTVSLSVYDTFGQKVISQDNAEFSAGENVINFDLSSYVPGYYIYSLESGAERVTGKVVVVK